MTRLVRDTEADVVLNALVGALGLEPTLAALESGARLALANKESLVAGGPLVLKAARPGQIVPVDSEHSALAQCLRAGSPDEVARLVLTASGGPFRGWSAEQLNTVVPAQAGAHPTWNMGPMNTLNSASLVNKGLELIETHLLFGIPYERIDVVVHPQSATTDEPATAAIGGVEPQAAPPMAAERPTTPAPTTRTESRSKPKPPFAFGADSRLYRTSCPSAPATASIPTGATACTTGPSR